MSKPGKLASMIITTVSLILLSVFIFILAANEVLPFPAILICGLLTPAIVTCAGYSIYYQIELKTGKTARTAIPLICLAAAVISGVIGYINYVNDQSFILRGLEAQLIWFLFSLPALVTAIVHFIAAYIQNHKVLNKLKNTRS